MPLAKGTEQPCNRTKEKNMKIKNVVFVPFIVLIYLILVQMSIPKKPLFYAVFDVGFWWGFIQLQYPLEVEGMEIPKPLQLHLISYPLKK